MSPARRRVPNRCPTETEDMTFADGTTVLEYTLGAGFDPETGRLTETFLKAGKDGSLLGRMLNDFAIVVSVALQYGVPAAAMAKSVG